MDFDFAFGAASAASFLLFAAAGKRGVCRAFSALFCRILRLVPGWIIFLLENHNVRKNGLSARKCEHFMNLSIFVQVLRTKTASRALLWEDFFPVTQNTGHICGASRAVRTMQFERSFSLSQSLSPKQLLFCTYFVQTRNGREAAAKCGYRFAQRTAARLLRRSDIRAGEGRFLFRLPCAAVQSAGENRRLSAAGLCPSIWKAVPRKTGIAQRPAAK